LYTSPDTIRMTKYIRRRWEGQVAQVGKLKNAHVIFAENPQGKYHFGDLSVDGTKILKWILEI